MPRPSKYSPELRERAVRMVFDHVGEHLCMANSTIHEHFLPVSRSW